MGLSNKLYETIVQIGSDIRSVIQISEFNRRINERLTSDITRIGEMLARIGLGGNNILVDPMFEQGHLPWGNSLIETGFDTTGNKTFTVKLKPDASVTPIGISHGALSRKTQIKRGKRYTLSFNVTTNSDKIQKSGLTYVHLMSGNSRPNQNVGTVTIPSNPELRTSITFTALHDSPSAYILIGTNTPGITRDDSFTVHSIRLERVEDSTGSINIFESIRNLTSKTNDLESVTSNVSSKIPTIESSITVIENKLKNIGTGSQNQQKPDKVKKFEELISKIHQPYPLGNDFIYELGRAGKIFTSNKIAGYAGFDDSQGHYDDEYNWIPGTNHKGIIRYKLSADTQYKVTVNSTNYTYQQHNDEVKVIISYRKYDTYEELLSSTVKSYPFTTWDSDGIFDCLIGNRWYDSDKGGSRWTVTNRIANSYDYESSMYTYTRETSDTDSDTLELYLLKDYQVTGESSSRQAVLYQPDTGSTYVGCFSKSAFGNEFVSSDLDSNSNDQNDPGAFYLYVLHDAHHVSVNITKHKTYTYK